MQEDRAARTQITADRALREPAILGFSDVTHYTLDEHYHLRLAPEAPSTAMRAVASVKHKVRVISTEDGSSETIHEVEFRLWDKNTALTNLAKHLGLLVERVEHSGGLELTFSSRLIAAKERALAARNSGVGA
jgi:phage terminase small subunit